MSLLKNKAYCKLCLDVIESKHRHDFVTCKCGSLSIDGGLAYRRVLWRGGEYEDVFGDMCEYVTPDDVLKASTISAIERDREQEYYKNLHEVVSREEPKNG